MGNLSSHKLKSLKRKSPQSNTNPQINFKQGVVVKNPHSFKNEYQIVKKIGNGKFGDVFEVVHKKTEKKRALKKIRKNDLSIEEREGMFKEIEILSKLDHPFILKIFEYFEDYRYFFIVTELHSTDLFDELKQNKRIDECTCASYFKKIVSAINYLQNLNICHRDIKTENILYNSSSNKVTLADFGDAIILKENETLSKVAGTLSYLSPETIIGETCYKSDNWALGVLLYLLLSGRYPFRGKSDQEIITKITKCKFDLYSKELRHVSAEAKNLIGRLLIKDPKERIELKDVLEHKWFKMMFQDTPFFNTSLIKKLKKFSRISELNKKLFRFLIFNFSSDINKTENIDSFNFLDKDYKGYLNRSDLKFGFKTANIHISDQSFENLFLKISEDKKKITFTDFLTATLHSKDVLNDENLTLCMKMIDTEDHIDGDSCIEQLMKGEFLDPYEILKIFKKLHNNPTEDNTLHNPEFRKSMMILSN